MTLTKEIKETIDEYFDEKDAPEDRQALLDAIMETIKEHFIHFDF